MQNVLIYDDRLASAEYTPTHPFKPVRAKLFIELLHRYFNIYDDRFVMKTPEPLDEELLYLFHDREYIELLKKAERGEFAPEMLQAGWGPTRTPSSGVCFSLPSP